jgi:hypothetical protein
MKRRSVCSIVGAAALVAIPAAGQSRQARPSRTPPDLQGIWQVLSTAKYDLQDHGARAGILLERDKPFPMALGIPAGKGVVEGNDIPYQPWAAAKKKENFALGLAADPLGKCYMPGVPRATYLPFPFQIFQTPKYVAMLYEYSHTYRVIYTDGTAHTEGLDFWMGDSRGRWDGNTLVVDVANFNDQTWFDMAGNFHSDALHVVERYTLIDPNTIRYQATIEDPKVFTRPWKMTLLLHRRRDLTRILEYECADLAEEAAGTFVDLPEEPRTRR